MTDVTGALLSRQVRREIERKKSKNVVLTVKPDYLKDLCSQAVAKEAAWFIFWAFVGSIVTVFTMSLFLVNGRHR